MFSAPYRMIFACLTAFGLLCFSGCGEPTSPYTGQALPYTPDPPREKEPNPVAVIKTSMGDITVELNEDDTPNTVANFITLAESGFYKNLVFHRIIKNFMIQGGCPKGDGTGDPGYKFRDEFEGHANKNDRYALSMANSGPNTNGSQFFIVTNPEGAHHLDPKHTVFGKVTEGKSVVDALNIVEVNGEKPKVEAKILNVEVKSKRKHEYEVFGKTVIVKKDEVKDDKKPKMNFTPPVGPQSNNPPKSGSRTITVPQGSKNITIPNTPLTNDPKKK